MKNRRRAIAVPFIALSSAIALTLAVSLPAHAASSGAKTQLCAGPVNAQSTISTTGYTNLWIGKYGTATYDWDVVYAGGTLGAKYSGFYQSWRWTVNATAIASATSKCV